jgi:amidase
MLAWESARVFAVERARHRELLSPRVERLFAKGDRIPTGDYQAARRVVDEARAAHDRWLAELGLDALLTPSAPGEAVPIDTTGDSIFNATWSTLGVPAITVPAGTGPLGLPLGVQLTGARWADGALFGPAAWVADPLAAAPVAIA